MKNPSDILNRVEQRFERTERAFQEFVVARRQQKRDALADFVVWARAVTNVMENVRNQLTGFDAWFKPHTTAMKNDVAMRRFYLMRSAALKQGRVDVEDVAVVISRGEWRPEPPEGATHFIVHDQETGKWGWLLRLPDGTERKELFEYPSGVEVQEFFTFVPALEDIDDIRVEASALRYLSYLRQMVDEFRVLVLRSQG